MSRPTRMMLETRKRSAKRSVGPPCDVSRSRPWNKPICRRCTARDHSLLVKHRTAVINQIRGLLAEYGLVMAQSPEKVRPVLVRFLAHRAGDAPGGWRVPGASGLPETGPGPGDWAVDGHGPAGDRRAASGISQRPASGGLFGAGASAIFQWGQGAIRRAFETRQSVCANALDSWGASRRPACRAEGGCARTVAVGAQMPQRHQCRRGGRSPATTRFSFLSTTYRRFASCSCHRIFKAIILNSTPSRTAWKHEMVVMSRHCRRDRCQSCQCRFLCPEVNLRRDS